jgi:hypothetical protein
MRIFTRGGGFISSHMNYQIITDRVGLNTRQINDILNVHELVPSIFHATNPGPLSATDIVKSLLSKVQFIY